MRVLQWISDRCLLKSGSWRDPVEWGIPLIRPGEERRSKARSAHFSSLSVRVAWTWRPPIHSFIVRPFSCRGFFPAVIPLLHQLGKCFPLIDAPLADSHYDDTRGQVFLCLPHSCASSYPPRLERLYNDRPSERQGRHLSHYAWQNCLTPSTSKPQANRVLHPTRR